MKLKKLSLFLSATLYMQVAAYGGTLETVQTRQPVANYQVIPLPQQIKSVKGDAFLLDDKVEILYPKGNKQMQKNACFLADYLQAATGNKYPIATDGKKTHNIVLSLDMKHENPEAYQVSISAGSVKITAPTETGIFYGIQFLRKSLPPAANTSISLPAVRVEDYPRFSYRGALLDVGRYFFTVDEVKTFIDMMALHNMNRFHWHLTEDQGWRIEIKKYPKLTEIGSVRKETVIGRNSDVYDHKPHGGFYTQKELKEIVRYASDRHITIIPEIDFPGHMQAALASYPELGCTGGPYEVGTRWGVSDQVLCVGQERTMQFLEDVLTEVFAIFPSEYIHIGGDECPKKQWEACPKCQARIKELGLQSDKQHTKEERLQSYVITRMEKFLNKHGRKAIGWDEILEGGLAPNATVMYWRTWCGKKPYTEAVKQGNDVIMTPYKQMYFDHAYLANRTKEPLSLANANNITTDSIYNYEPIPAGFTPEEQKHFIGLQGNVWTELISTFPHVQYMSLPRFAALCEIQWTLPEKKDYNSFLNRLPQLVKIYDAESYDYAKHLFK